jgi:serine/threonine-protein kinase
VSEHPAAIGKYRVDRVLGEGAMGVVYQGHDPHIDRVVAIKTLHAHLVARAERAAWLDRFAREAKAAGRCLHPNLVTVFDYLEVEGRPYIVMEYIEAPSLAARMAVPPPVPLGEVEGLMRQILEGLAHIHAAGIVHRDVKPENLLLLADGRLKIADFGVARVESLGATWSGMIGTPAYMSPEQFAGRPADHRADLFAAGVILYELLSGQKPFPTGSLGELQAALMAGRHRPLAEAAPGVPPHLEMLVARALHPEPAGRFATARDFAAALATALRGGALAAFEGWDRTIIAPAPGARSAPASVGASVGGSLADRMPKAVFAQIETLLAERIGPIARVVLRNAAASTNEIDRLVDMLCGQVAAPDRDAFRAAARRLLGAGGEEGGAGLSPEVLAELTRLLTRHVGPIARLLVRKAAAESRTRAELTQSLAAHIASEADRAAFLRSVA